MLTLEQFGGGRGATPSANVRAFRKALSAAVKHADIGWPGHRAKRIKFGPGRYQFDEPIHHRPRWHYQSPPLIEGEGGGVHTQYAGTTLEFKYQGDAPCLRIEGNGGALRSLFIHAEAHHHCALELGNDAWPGRVNEPGFTGDAWAKRMILDDVGTWGGVVGCSLRGWVMDVRRLVINHPQQIGVRMAGNAITLRDMYYSISKQSACGVYVEFGSGNLIQGGAIETSPLRTPEGHRARCPAAIFVRNAHSLTVDTVYMEGQACAVQVQRGDGIEVRNMMRGVRPPRTMLQAGDSDEYTTGSIVEISDKVLPEHVRVTTGRLMYGIRPVTVVPGLRDPLEVGGIDA